MVLETFQVYATFLDVKWIILKSKKIIVLTDVSDHPVVDGEFPVGKSLRAPDLFTMGKHLKLSPIHFKKGCN